MEAATGPRSMADGLSAAGLTVRDIQAHLLDLYGLKVSPDLISRVTDAVLDEVREWQSRALGRMYPIRRRENGPPPPFSDPPPSSTRCG
jgi:hypothetical protein